MALMETIPAWVQVVFCTGSLVFGGGILYGDVQDIKQGLEKSEAAVSQVGSLRAELTEAKRSNEKVISAVDKLSEAVGSLSINVARLEERTSNLKR